MQYFWHRTQAFPNLSFKMNLARKLQGVELRMSKRMTMKVNIILGVKSGFKNFGCS